MSPTKRRPRDVAPETAYSAPRFAVLWAALVYAICTLALGFQALSGAFLVSPTSDQYGGFAYREFAASVMSQSGGFPQWNPYILGGIPYIAAQHGDIFYPSFLLRMILPADKAMTWGFLLHIFLAGLFTYGLLRAWRFRFTPALLGGLGYMMSGQIASLVSPGHDGKLYVSALAPLLLWMILKGIRDGKVWAYGVIAIVTGLCVLSPHYQMTYYLGVFAAGFAIWLTFRVGDEALDRRTRIVRLGSALGAAILGMVIGAVQFAPFFEYIPYAARGVEHGWLYSTNFSEPPEELINTYLPQFSGILEHYAGRNPLKFHTEYLGVVILMFAGAAFGSEKRRGLVRFWSIAGFFVLLVALGRYTPFYHLWWQLPYMKVVRAPGMIFFLLSLGTAIFSAIGLERILAGEKRDRYFLIWIGFAAVMALLALGGILSSMAASFANPQYSFIVEENSGRLTVGAIRSLAFVVLAAGAVLLWRRSIIPERYAIWGIIVLAVVDFWSIDRHFFRYSPPASELYAADPTLTYLSANSDSGRVVALSGAALGLQGANTAFNDPLLGGDALMIHRIRAATGHQANELQRWVELAGAKSPAPPPNFLSPQWRRVANVKYWLTNVDLPSEIPAAHMRLTKLMGPVQNAVGSTVYLYRLEEDNPPAWVTPVYVEAPADAIGGTVLNPAFDASRAALFDSTEILQGVADIEQLPPALDIHASVTRPDESHINVTLSAQAPEGSALVVSENWYPRWTAEIDGKTVPTARADYTFIGLPLPAGATSIQLSYEDPAYARGKLLTWIALAIATVIIAAGVVIDRRRRG